MKPWTRGKGRTSHCLYNDNGDDPKLMVAQVYDDEESNNGDLVFSAVNACIAINPDHPEVVAEGIGEMWRTLNVVLSSVRRRLVKWEQGCLKEDEDSIEYGCDKMFEKTLSDLIAKLEAK